MKIEDDLFKKKEVIIDELIKYGFVLENGMYVYKTKITASFLMVVHVSDKVRGYIMDLDFNEEYVNFRNENLEGEFSRKIRNKFTDVLKDICDKCFMDKYFTSDQANRICGLIEEKYGDKPIFKWDNYDGAVFENNGKWYGLIMNVSRNKIDGKKGKVDILNVKLDKNKVVNLLSEDGYYKAYHMNKKSWISVILDEVVSDDNIFNLIDESYSFTVDNVKSDNEWVMPINPGYFDVFGYFDSQDLFYWEKKNYKKNDIIYLYITKPIKAIMYKCFVEDITDDFMLVRKVCKYEKKKYSLEVLKKYGLTSVRSSRHIPKSLSKLFKEDEV
ncbi:MAG: MmcQ/YjbR family DNA-binding protein [Bacilli bacterium]|nr:MmcQ/YjbR family DNA-binding protein [Bacilli bacterium]